jgi:glucose-fructose oxidoreductase
MKARNRRAPVKGVVRYAVVGLGHIAQVAILPAFAHSKKNSRLVALFSDDEVKRRELGKRYRVPYVAPYNDYDRMLAEGIVDAVYIALPNSMHLDFAARAAKAGVHVLCEKPLTSTAHDSEKMIAACERYGVKLMTAYRLHFEKSNLEAIKIARSGKLGELRYFNSIFSMQANHPNIRLEKKMGGGPLHDLGVYCINAARNLFRAEPTEVFGVTATGRDPRFREVPEMVSATLRFPGEKIATFVCSFGAANASICHMVGTRGRLELRNAYEYVEPIELQMTIDDKETKRKFQKRDQFAPELLYFSECVLKNKKPEPSGEEGLADVRIVEALYQSAKSGRPVRLPVITKRKRPSLAQEIRRPAVSFSQILSPVEKGALKKAIPEEGICRGCAQSWASR